MYINLTIILFVIACVINTLFPGEGYSNGLVFVLIVLIVYDRCPIERFTFIFLSQILAYLMLASIGMHGIDLKDISAAINISCLTTIFLVSPKIDDTSKDNEKFHYTAHAILLISTFMMFTEFLFAFIQGSYTAYTAFPRSSSPIRLDPFISEIPFGSAVDPNNLAIFVLLLVLALKNYLSVKSSICFFLIDVITTGSRIAAFIIIYFLLKLKPKYIFYIAILFALAAVIIPQSLIEMYSGRFDFAGTIEGSFIDRYSRIEDTINLLSFLPPDDNLWQHSEGDFTFASSYNGYLNIWMRYGLLGFIFFSMTIICSFYRNIGRTSNIIPLLMASLTGEYFYNSFIVFASVIALVIYDIQNSCCYKS